MIRWMRGLLMAMSVSVASCASPTLPLPPPAAPDVTPSTTPGKIHLSSKLGAEPNAIIVTYNRNPNVALDERVDGSQADGDGNWDADVTASSGDYIDITQEFGDIRSPPVTVHVP